MTRTAMPEKLMTNSQSTSGFCECTFGNRENLAEDAEVT